MSDIIIQGIGFIAVALFITSYQIKSNRLLFLFQLLGSALFCLQFFLLGAISGCLSLAVNILRNALMMKYKEWAWVRSKVSCSDSCPVYGCDAFYMERTCQPSRFCRIGIEHLCILVGQPPQDTHGQSCMRFPLLAGL